ncbi:TetR/AcrR family transcriptional regulator [Streptomyces sp. I6]|uniref:TetR/AcrR family transcriptional regulator n=1 Tax=Streptomyces sp. I6 TaxID=2483113 RepID=UPI000F4591FB|nr:TetR/AcrR family transcriptional regulator [Streptomyces sp. I6]RNL73608.1 TetR/AcrR family transcriptional regulator [Streptomyces sp. I6]
MTQFDEGEALDAATQLFWQRGVANTDIQDVAAAAGINGEALELRYGDQQQLFAASLRRYVDRHSMPKFSRLSDAEDGLPAIEGHFESLIQRGESGPLTGQGCLITNAHAGPEAFRDDVNELLRYHHQRLWEAMRSALARARTKGQVRNALDVDSAAEALTLLAYGVNLRSRVGADADTLRRAVATTIGMLKP